MLRASGSTASPRRRLARWAGWFGAANTLLLAAISLRNLAVSDPPTDGLPLLFCALMFLGHAAFLAFLPILPLLLLIAVWPRPAAVLGMGVALQICLAYAALVDTVIYHQYRFHLNAEVFNLLFGGAAGEILVFPTALYVQSALGLVAVAALETALGVLLWKRTARAARRRLGAAIAALLVSAFLLQAGIHAWSDLTGYTPITRQGRWLLGYVPFTAEQMLRRLGFEAQRVHAELRTRDHGTGLAYPREPLTCAAPPGERPNLLFLVIDSWRFDALDAVGTPHIFALAEQSQSFTDHWSGGSATRTGIFSLFYGLPGTYWHAMLAERRGPVLITELQRQGYEVAAFASATLTNPEFDRTVFADVTDLRLGSDGGTPSARDEDLTADFLSFLEQRTGDRPFFAFLFYDSPHAYDVPAGAAQPFQPSLERVNYLALGPDFDPVPFHNRYRNSVLFDDSLVGRVLEALEQRGLMDRTVIAVTGDHGQEFNENGLNFWGHDSNFSRYQVAVPLVLHWPGRGPGVVSHRTSHLDLAPTILRDLLGCSNPPADYSAGHPLFEPGGRESLLLANYTDYALLGSDRLIAVYPYGVEVLDLRYRPIPGAAPDAATLRQALELRSRFYR